MTQRPRAHLRTCAPALLAAALAVALAPAAARVAAPVAGEAPDAAGTALLDARAAFVDGDAARLAALAPALSGKPLQIYVEYWLANLALHAPAPDPAPAQLFLARYAGTALAERLRTDWLLVLGAAGDWAGFDAERRHLQFGSDDVQVACYAQLARYALDDGKRREAFAREARHLLVNTTDPGGDGCSALAARLLDDGALSLWARLQALVERNQITAAQAAADRLEPANAAALKRMLADPGAWLRTVEKHLEQMPHPFPLLAIVALAREDPERAAHYADILDPALSAEERALVWGRVGRAAEWSLLPRAPEWFERGGALVGAGNEYVRADDVLEARARAALRRCDPGASPGGAETEKQWRALQAAIGGMPVQMQALQVWVYWNAQAQLALGKGAEGHAALRGLADHFSYYGRLAAEQLGEPLRLAPAPPAPPAARVDALAQRAGFVRAGMLYALGLRDEGMREWNWEARGLDDSDLQAAAEVARRLGAADRMIATAERAHGVVDMQQRYPMPYPDLMQTVTAPLGVEPAWVYGLIRQESRFLADVRSSAGALGLMQLMPATARFVAHHIGLADFRADRVTEAPMNLRLGTEYLKLVLDDQDGRLLLAAAAYNAGPARVRKWRAGQDRTLDGAVFVETIPIQETREYVKHVLFNAVVYGALLGHPQALQASLLAPVPARAVPATYLP